MSNQAFCSENITNIKPKTPKKSKYNENIDGQMVDITKVNSIKFNDVPKKVIKYEHIDTIDFFMKTYSSLILKDNIKDLEVYFKTKFRFRITKEQLHSFIHDIIEYKNDIIFYNSNKLEIYKVIEKYNKELFSSKETINKFVRFSNFTIDSYKDIIDFIIEKSKDNLDYENVYFIHDQILGGNSISYQKKYELYIPQYILDENMTIKESIFQIIFDNEMKKESKIIEDTKKRKRECDDECDCEDRNKTSECEICFSNTPMTKRIARRLFTNLNQKGNPYNSCIGHRFKCKSSICSTRICFVCAINPNLRNCPRCRAPEFI